MSAAEALAWISERLGDFRMLERRILNGMHEAAVRAGATPEGPQRDAARATVRRWGSLLTSHQSALNRWDAIADRIPGLSGLGIVPVVPLAMAAAVVAVAASMALIMRRLTAEERLMAQLRSGDITPEQAVDIAAQLEGGRAGLFGGGMVGIVPLALGAGALLFLARR